MSSRARKETRHLPEKDAIGGIKRDKRAQAGLKVGYLQSNVVSGCWNHSNSEPVCLPTRVFRALILYSVCFFL